LLYNIFRKRFQKVLIWTLILIMAISNLFIIIGSPKKAKAAEPDPQNPGFYKAEAGVETPQNFQYHADSDGTMVMTWEHTRGHSTTMVPGFIVKSGAKAPIDCTRGAWGSSGAVNNMTCDDQSSFSATNEESGDNRVSKYTFHDKGVTVSALPAGMSLLVQVLVPLIGYSPIVGAKVEGSVNNVVLGPGFEEDNIDKYIANKLLPYQKSGKEVPGTSSDWVGEALFASKEDQNNFKSFMENFKNAAGSENRLIIKELDAGNVDPFGIQGFTEDKNGQKVYHPALSESELTTIYDKYYKNYQGFSNNKDFIAFINDQINQYNELMKGKENSCQDLVNRLTTSDTWKQAYSQFGAVIGGGGTAILGAFTGGMSLPWTGGAAAGGYVVGETIEEMVRASQKDDIDKQLLDITKKSWAAYYSLLYVEFKETKLGLNAYANKGDNLTQEVGINPNKIQIITNVLAEFDNSWNICFKSVTQLMNDLYNDNCGISKLGPFSDILATALCAVLKLMGDIAEWMINNLFTSVFTAFHPPPAKIAMASVLTNPFKISSAHAADEVSTLSQALTVGGGKWDWVIPAWKWSLGLTDLFLVIILLFLGIVNILHIQYDTYNLKKALPLLIVGVLLANFSLLVMRMLIDAANILTNSFMNNQDPGTMAKSMIIAAHFGTQPGFMGAVTKLGGLLLAIIFSVFILAAFLILGFMFYMRYAAVILLAIVAPIAFVFMAFPPTQSIFKQWWSWTTKMIFMKPLAFFLLYIAWKIEKSGNMGTSLTGWIIVTFIVYMAILIPWKLGGALASFWGGVGGTVFGTKKGGWARKPVDEWWQRRKDQAGALAKVALPGLFAGAEKDRLTTEAMKKSAAAKLGQRAWRDPRTAAWTGKALTEENKLNSAIAEQNKKYENAELKMGWLLRLTAGGIKWKGNKPAIKSPKDIAKDSIYSAAELVLRTKDLESHRKDTVSIAAAELGKKNNALTEALNKLKGKGIGTKLYEIDKKGKLIEKEDYELDEKGNFKLDRDGNKIRKLGGFRENLELASILRTRAAATLDDDELSRNLEASANQLEREALDFANKNPIVDDIKIPYQAFMDKRFSGRVLSAVTPWLMEDVQTNLLNENPESLYERSIKGGGNRNIRITGREMEGDFNDFIAGKRTNLNTMQSLTIGALLVEWLNQMERGGKKNRTRSLANFLKRVDGGGILGDQGALLDALLKKEEFLSPNLTQGFVAEQILNARRRGLTKVGDLDISKFDWEHGNVEGNRISNAADVVHALSKVEIDGKPFDAIDFLKKNQSIFTQIDTSTRTAANQFTNQMIDGLTDSITEMKIFCGGGNPIIQMMQATDIPENDRFKDISIPNPEDQTPENMEAYRNRVAEKRRIRAERLRRIDQQEVALSQIQPENVTAGEATRVLKENSEAIDDINLRQNQILQDIQIGGTPITLGAFQSQIAQAITSSVAKSFRELEAELGQKFAGIKLNVPPPDMDTEDALSTFKEEVAKVNLAVQHVQRLDETQEAEDYRVYAPVRQNESEESLKASLTQLKDAADTFQAAVKSMGAQPQLARAQELPPAVMEKLIDAISSRGQTIPLSQQVLESHPDKSAEVLRKMIISLQAALNVRQSGQALNNENILKAIKTELRNLNTTLSSPNGESTIPPQPAGEGQAGGGAGGQAAQGGEGTVPPYTPNEEMPPEE